MMAKPMKTLELHYLMIQFLIKVDVRCFVSVQSLAHTLSRNAGECSFA